MSKNRPPHDQGGPGASFHSFYENSTGSAIFAQIGQYARKIASQLKATSDRHKSTAASQAEC